MRLIDADALDMYECLRSYYGDAWRDAQKAIDDAPTVDAVEVVRCKDCRYYHVYLEGNGHTEKGYGACDWINDKSVREDHFCSWGERKK